jgi:hypothetical protein
MIEGNSDFKKEPLCERCGRVFRPIECHGHLQCASCGQIKVGGDCCQGSQISSNSDADK